jgi:hypothetical protein
MENSTQPKSTNLEGAIVINFEQETFIKTVPAYNVNSKTIKIIQLVDLPIDKKVIAQTYSQIGSIVLWEGEAYDAIGDWTNQDVIDRVKEMFTEPAQLD